MIHSFMIRPKTYTAFETEAEQIEKCKEWNLLSEKATKTKVFFYKGNGMNIPCNMIGYVDAVTAVIAFDNQQHCIHPSYLKEMQAANYSQKLTAAAIEKDEENHSEAEAQAPTPEAATILEAEIKESPKGKVKKEKVQKLQLPEGKVKMIATVVEFTSVPNNFSDTEDEVVIYEAVSIDEPALQVGTAWSSHSATLKKYELAIGDTITFEGKIVVKKLTKHPVPYKINNPAKIVKETTAN